MDKVEKRRFSVTLTEPYIVAIDKLVEKGLYNDGPSLIREALRKLFEYYGVSPFKKYEPD